VIASQEALLTGSTSYFCYFIHSHTWSTVGGDWSFFQPLPNSFPSLNSRDDSIHSLGSNAKRHSHLSQIQYVHLTHGAFRSNSMRISIFTGTPYTKIWYSKAHLTIIYSQIFALPFIALPRQQTSTEYTSRSLRRHWLLFVFLSPTILVLLKSHQSHAEVLFFGTWLKTLPRTVTLDWFFLLLVSMSIKSIWPFSTIVFPLDSTSPLYTWSNGGSGVFQSNLGRRIIHRPHKTNAGITPYSFSNGRPHLSRHLAHIWIHRNHHQRQISWRADPGTSKQTLRITQPFIWK